MKKKKKSKNMMREFLELDTEFRKFITKDFALYKKKKNNKGVKHGKVREC